MVLIWGMWLSYKIRNAPPAYNESKMISWAVYSAMFVTSFLMVLRSVFQFFCSEHPRPMCCNKRVATHRARTSERIIIAIIPRIR